MSLTITPTKVTSNSDASNLFDHQNTRDKILLKSLNNTLYMRLTWENIANIHDPNPSSLYSLQWSAEEAETLRKQLLQNKNKLDASDIHFENYAIEGEKEIGLSAIQHEIATYIQSSWEEKNESDQTQKDWQEQKAIKGPGMIQAPQILTGNITHKIYDLDEDQTYEAKLVRRALKAGYSTLLQLENIRPFLSSELSIQVNNITARLETELKTLHDFAELFCFRIITKKQSSNIDTPSTYQYVCYDLSSFGSFKKKYLAPLLKLAPDITELASVVFEYCSSSEGDAGNTNATNFSILEDHLNGKKTDKTYSEENEANEAKYAMVADGFLLATNIANTVNKLSDSKWFDKLKEFFFLSEQTRIVELSHSLDKHFNLLPSYEVIARNVGMLIFQAQAILKNLTPAQDILKDRASIVNSWNLQKATWDMSTAQYIEGLLPKEADNEAKTSGAKMKRRRASKKARVKQKKQAQISQQQVFQYLTSYEKRAIVNLNVRLRATSMVPAEKRKSTEEQIAKLQRLNRRI